MTAAETPTRIAGISVDPRAPAGRYFAAVVTFTRGLVRRGIAGAECASPPNRRLMRRLTLFILCLAFVPAMLRADTWMKVREHADASYHHGTVDPAVDSESEIWIGGGRIASIDKDRHYIIDVTAGRLIVAEKADTAYVETTLPFSLSVILPEEVRPRAAMFQATGEVTRLEETRMIGGRLCRGMDGTFVDRLSRNQVQRDRANRVDRRGPAGRRRDSRDYYDVVWKMNNFNDGFVAALKGMGGWEMMTESVTYSEGQAVKSYSLVEEIAEKEAPAGVYEVPGGYRKKEFIRVGG